jgi:ParB family transcriptional regulator, chromosome partitioning protein
VSTQEAPWTSAKTVRRTWLAEFARRKTAPKGAAEYIAHAIATDIHSLRRAGERGHKLASDLIAKAAPSRAQHIALVLALAAREAETGVQTWRRESAERAYLSALESWGYTFSDVEQIARGGAPSE